LADQDKGIFDRELLLDFVFVESQPAIHTNVFIDITVSEITEARIGEIGDYNGHISPVWCCWMGSVDFVLTSCAGRMRVEFDQENLITCPKLVVQSVEIGHIEFDATVVRVNTRTVCRNDLRRPFWSKVSAPPYVTLALLVTKLSHNMVGDLHDSKRQIET
jgi:hypothetical protein